MVNRARSLLDQYRSQGARTLLDRARTVAVQLLNPPPTYLPPRPALAAPPAPPTLETVAPQHSPVGTGQAVLADMCAHIALRDLNLVDSLLAQLEKMEANEDDPDTLAQLYGLDHLVTRLRRNAENLRVLAGQEAGGAAEETSSLVDVIRAALSSIEQYTRVEVGRVAALAVVGFAADDVGRLLAELLDNATSQSPPSTSVLVSAHLTERGSVLLRLEDSGIGLPEDRMDRLNEWLASEPVLDNDSIDQMGLAVVRRLAGKHHVKVWLGRRAPHGTTASVLLPPDLVREAAPTSFARRAEPQEPEATPAPARRPERGGNGLSGLPRRGGPPRHALSDGPAVAATTTPSGLPRRIPHSLRDRAPVSEGHVSQETLAEQPELDPADRDQFLADLGDFAEGERAALSEHAAQREPEPVVELFDADRSGTDHRFHADPFDAEPPIQLKGQISDD